MITHHMVSLAKHKVSLHLLSLSTVCQTLGLIRPDLRSIQAMVNVGSLDPDDVSKRVGSQLRPKLQDIVKYI